MGIPSAPELCLLFTGLLFREEKYFSLSREMLRSLFGPICLESESLPWEHSGYYAEELGSPITRTFLFFGHASFSQEKLAEVKLLANSLEQSMATGGRRNINIDPGYLTLSKVVLASTKNYVHRIYIGRGIYAEVTLVFRDGGYKPHLFTYADYASDAYREIFMRARNFLKR